MRVALGGLVCCRSKETGVWSLSPWRILMKVKTGIKAGGRDLNHNEAQARGESKGLKVKAGVKAGALNHNEAQARGESKGLKVKSGVKAGGFNENHNEAQA